MEKTVENIRESSSTSNRILRHFNSKELQTWLANRESRLIVTVSISQRVEGLPDEINSRPSNYGLTEPGLVVGVPGTI